MAIRRGTHDRLGSDIAGRAEPVLDDEWLAKTFREPFTYQTCENVGRATGGKTRHDAHRPRRIGLRPSDARDGRQRGSARGQMQEIFGGEVSLASSSLIGLLYARKWARARDASMGRPHK